MDWLCYSSGGPTGLTGSACTSPSRFIRKAVDVVVIDGFVAGLPPSMMIIYSVVMVVVVVIHFGYRLSRS